MRFGTGAEAAGVVGLAAAMLADMIRFRFREDLVFPPTLSNNRLTEY